MSQTPHPNDPRPADRPNPSVESTRLDDARDRELHQNAGGVGAAAGSALGCLGVSLGPFLAIIVAVAAAIVVAVVARGCKSGGGATGGATQQSNATPAAQVERAASAAR